MSEAEQLSGEEMLAQNMAALDSGDDLPHEEDMVEPSDGLEGDIVGEESQPEEVEEPEDDSERKSHISRDDWEASGKDPDAYLTPDEFDRAGDLKSESQLSLAKKLAQSEALMREVLSNQQKALDDNTKRAQDEIISKLKAEQAEAVEFGDTSKAVELERKIANQEAVDKPVDNSNTVDPSIQSFYESNSDWYNVDPAATGMLNVELQRANKRNLPFDEAIGPALDKVKRQFHYLFDDGDAPQPKKESEKARPKPRPRVTSEKSRAPSKASGKKLSFNDLDPSMATIAKRSAKAAGMTEQQYMEALA